MKSTIGLEPLFPGQLNVGIATGISDGGLVVGWSAVPVVGGQDQHAVVWEGGTIPQDLGGLQGSRYYLANAVTANGSTIVGESLDAALNLFAVRWQKIGGAWKLDAFPTPDGGNNCRAVDIASDGSVGGSCTYSGFAHAVIWRNGVATDVGRGFAVAINANGQLLGSSCNPDCVVGVWNFRSNPIAFSPLPTLGGASTAVHDINNNGEVVGEGQKPGSGSFHAFVWSAKKGIVELPELPGLTSSGARGINELGQIVGVLGSHGAYWNKGKGYDVGVLTPYDFAAASAINLVGQAVGWSTLTQPDNVRATMWTLK